MMKMFAPRIKCRALKVLLLTFCLAVSCRLLRSQDAPCSKDRANQWYQQQPRLVGANFLPSNAINELEMWQPETFDSAEIDREFGWAEGLGMNTMRVFLHNLLWDQDAAGFRHRLDEFLAIAARHHIRPLQVLFDSCWDPDPRLGPQRPPIPGVHNSCWVQAPDRAILSDPTVLRGFAAASSVSVHTLRANSLTEGNDEVDPTRAHPQDSTETVAADGWTRTFSRASVTVIALARK